MIGKAGTPIELDFKSAGPGGSSFVTPGDFKGFRSLRTFTSYSFDKNILVPASAFRFTAPGVDKETRTAIRSGDLVELFVINGNRQRNQIATGFVDETDLHVSGSSVEYVISGRDTMGQLIDNAAVDRDNKIVHFDNLTITGMMEWIVKNTRMPQRSIINPNVPTGTFSFRTNPGETKISSIQRYLEFCNCLIWSHSNGQAIVGKPNFTQAHSGKLIVSREYPQANNVLEARVKRNLNTTIRTIATVLQNTEKTDVTAYTLNNADPDVSARSKNLVGRSLLRTFSYGSGMDVINIIHNIGNSGAPEDIGRALSLREIARENMKVLGVEVVVKGHINENGIPYDIDQIYDVNIADDDVKDALYVYACTYNLTQDRGITTTLRLCKLNTIVAFTEIAGRAW